MTMSVQDKSDLPSKLPCSEQYSSSLVYVSRDGRNTNTPELKQSGQPGSGAADSSSLSNSSSIFESTWEGQRQQRNVCVATVTSKPKSHHRVCVHEDTFGVMCESPALEFGEGDPQVRPLHHGQMRRVAAVQHVHHSDLVKDAPQHRPEGSQDYRMNRSDPDGGRWPWAGWRSESGQGHLTGKARTPPARWAPPASWTCRACEGTCPRPWLPERNCHWSPASQKPAL